MHLYRPSCSLPPVIASFLTGIACLMLGAPTLAQDSNANGAPVPDGDLLQGLSLGIAAQYSPQYPGAHRQRLTLLPILRFSRDAFFVDSLHGIGLQYENSVGFYASASLGYDLGRAQTDSRWRPGSRRLAGMGDIGKAATINLFVAQPLGSGLSLQAEADLRVAGHDRGNRYLLGLEHLAVRRSADMLVLTANLFLGDGRYNANFFGVSPTQAGSTTMARFDTGAGVYAYSLRTHWQLDLSKQWSSHVEVEWLRYGPRAAGSPVVQRRNALIVTTGLTYTF